METLYGIKNGIGYYYVVGKDLTDAESKLQRILDHHDYGTSQDRKTKSIDIIATEMKDEILGVSGNFFLP